MPTVSKEAVFPAQLLYSKPIRNVLSDRMVRPVVDKQWSVAAVRLSWPKDEARVQAIWQKIVKIRQSMDELAKCVPLDCVFLVSSISGSMSTQRRVCSPSLGYWIVARSHDWDCKLLPDHFHTNTWGATAKLLLQPYQKAHKDYSNTLFTIVKDNVSGCVPRLIQTSLRHCYGEETELWEPATKIWVSDQTLRDTLGQTVSNLMEVRFQTQLLEF